jgi:hypothetical protein
MSNRWTLDDIKEKGLRIIDTRPANVQNAQQRYQALGRMKAGKMNKTEIAYSNYLEFQKKMGEVLWYEFEPMNLRLADKCFYKVDFLVLTKEMFLEVHEVKGFMTDDSLVKFKTAGEKFPFKFRMIALVKGRWIEKYSN